MGACCASGCYGVVGALQVRQVRVGLLGGWGGKRTLRPYFIDICPAARLMRSLGTKRGETFLGPWGQLTLVDGRPRAGETNTFVESDGRVVLHF